MRARERYYLHSDCNISSEVGDEVSASQLKFELILDQQPLSRLRDMDVSSGVGNFDTRMRIEVTTRSYFMINLAPSFDSGKACRWRDLPTGIPAPIPVVA